MIKAVIFDMDDTLISEYEYIKSGYKVISETLAQKYNLDGHKIHKELLEIYHKDGKQVFNQWFELKEIQYSRENILELVNVYRTHTPQISFFSDVLPCVKWLKDKNIKTGIISDGYLDTQKRKIAVLEATKYFNKIILTDELGKEFWKPDIRAFEMIKKCLGVAYDEMMYVGDNPQKDFYMKKEIPIVTVRIERNNGLYSKKEYLGNVKEDYSIKTLREIIELCSKT